MFATNFIVSEIKNLSKYEKIVASECNKYSIDKNLVLAIIKTESNFNKNVVSRKNAKGLMQLLDETATYISKLYNITYNGNLFEENINIKLGIAYLDYLYKKFKHTDLVLASYNAGEGNVKKWIDCGVIIPPTINVLPYKETQNYIKKVKLTQKLYNLIN